MTGPDYVWMIIGWYRKDWWRDEDPNVRCTVQEMRLAVEGTQYFSTESLQLSTSEKPTVAGIVRNVGVWFILGVVMGWPTVLWPHLRA